MLNSTITPSPTFIQPELCGEIILLCFVPVSESSMTNSSEVETLAIQPHKLLILDARSYAAAVANRAKGGGCECPGRSAQLSHWLQTELGQYVLQIQGLS